MGLFLCPLCDQQLSATDHVCNKGDILKRIEKYEQRVGEKERELHTIRNALLRLLEEVTLDTDTVTMSTEWLRKLWSAAQMERHETKTADQFIVRWLALHQILRSSFDLFRSRKYGKKRNLLEKLTALRQACDQAKEVMGYENSVLDMEPKNLLE